jgi:hypothetical protein
MGGEIAMYASAVAAGQGTHLQIAPCYGRKDDNQMDYDQADDIGDMLELSLQLLQESSPCHNRERRIAQSCKRAVKIST